MDLYETEETFRKSVARVPHKKTPLEWHFLDKVIRVRIRSGISALPGIDSKAHNRNEMSDGIEVVAFELPVFC
jgi:hypothetical protein